MKKYILSLFASMTLVSCVDTVILPDNLIVDEDFWQNKNDVNSMVSAAYAGMTSNNVIQRAIVWGDFRADEMVVNKATTIQTNSTVEDLKEIATVNTQSDNVFCSWADLYTVINRCNIVLDKAENVMNIDPNYTRGDYDSHRAQMLTLRALCYFYLVRAFRDVPYITTSFMSDSQDNQISQSSPLDVINGCINDLETSLTIAPSPKGYSLVDWKRVGWFNTDGVKALLADIYLWRGSVLHQQSDYQRCMDLCQEIITSKTEIYNANHPRMTLKTGEYPLVKSSELYETLFTGNQNAEESIFELQSSTNVPIMMFNKAIGSEPYVKAGTVFTSSLYSVNDLRWYMSFFDPTSETNPRVRKLVSAMAKSGKTWDAYNNTTYKGTCHFILYRLTDVMLMKAEAMVQTVSDAMDATAKTAVLHDAFDLVSAVNTRGFDASNTSDALKWGTYQNKTKDEFEQLVMEERLRELCFEGKRWFDLMRFNYRHVEGVDYSRTLAEIGADNLAPVYADMVTLMTRSNEDDAAGVRGKLTNEAYLYMPVSKDEIILCPALNQNPVFGGTSGYNRNF